VLLNNRKENYMSKLRQRLQREEGFTLIELLVVIVILGILLAIAVPSYLTFKDRANQTAAQSDVRAAIPAAEAYYADYGDYAFSKTQAGGTAATALDALKSYDQGLKLDHAAGVGTGNASYCLDVKVGDKTASVTRGAAPASGGDITKGTVCS
jgi:prepilin-type N-terminal cleavage/methylation domain-containing protein